MTEYKTGVLLGKCSIFLRGFKYKHMLFYLENIRFSVDIQRNSLTLLSYIKSEVVFNLKQRFYYIIIFFHLQDKTGEKE
jgi:hypothetical protein